jgi:hypothetical protein
MSKATEPNTTPASAPPTVAASWLPLPLAPPSLAPLTMAGAALTKSGANPDAELIRLCDRSTTIQATICMIFATRGPTLEVEERTEPFIDALYDEHHEVEAALCEVPDPRTIEGYRAMDPSVLANAEKELDGSVSTPGGYAEWLAFDLCRVLVEGGAA